MDAYHPDTVFSLSIDQFGPATPISNQPQIAVWNLGAARDRAVAVDPGPRGKESSVHGGGERLLRPFRRPALPNAVLRRKARARPGARKRRPGPGPSTSSTGMAGKTAPISPGPSARSPAPTKARVGAQRDSSTRPALDPWLDRWQARLAEEDATDPRRPGCRRRTPPAFPRNHRIEQRRSRPPWFGRFLAAAYEDADGRPAAPSPMTPPSPIHEGRARDRQRVTRTFCGT